MTTLTGKVTFPKEALSHDFLNREPATRKSAYTDLWFWANDRARTLTVGTGRNVNLARGQLAFSMETLAKIWRWNREKAKAVLIEFQNEGLITFESSNTITVITVIDYAVFNADSTPEPTPDQATKPPPESDTKPPPDPAQKWEVGSKKMEEGKYAPAREVEIPKLEEVRTWAEMAPGVDPEYAEAQWRTTTGNDAWQTRTGKLIDWRNLWIGRWIQDRSGWFSRKNGGGKAPGTANGLNGRTPAQALFEMRKELEEVRDAIEACRQSGAEPDPEDLATEKNLEKKLAELGG